ncbi:hypothetical protein ACHAWC_005370 [Mediolabrus comicus]
MSYGRGECDSCLLLRSFDICFKFGKKFGAPVQRIIGKDQININFYTYMNFFPVTVASFPWLYALTLALLAFGMPLTVFVNTHHVTHVFSSTHFSVFIIACPRVPTIILAFKTFEVPSRST